MQPVREDTAEFRMLEGMDIEEFVASLPDGDASRILGILAETPEPPSRWLSIAIRSVRVPTDSLPPLFSPS